MVSTRFRGDWVGQGDNPGYHDQFLDWLYEEYVHQGTSSAQSEAELGSETDG
jgi:hypothetical protein